MQSDRNFDDLFHRFQNRIKASTKGLLRETLLREDLQSHIPHFHNQSLRVLDAGCGLGDMSIWLAQHGHQVCAADISQKMLEATKACAEASSLSIPLEIRQNSLHELLNEGRRYDLICIHAVLEWMAEPYAIIPLLARCLNPGGRLSLSIYNRHRSILNSLVKGNFRVAINEDFGSNRPNSMTPPNPIDPDRLHKLLLDLGYTIELRAGLRCFYDLLPTKLKEERSYEDILLLERRYRQASPFRDIARYVHFIACYKEKETLAAKNSMGSI